MGAAMSTNAAVLKQKGNQLFKAGALEEASKLYAQAEQADCSDPVYPSNLSAALFEIGDYLTCIDAVLRASRLLKEDPEPKVDLIVRLFVRVTKALCHGVRCGSVTVTEYDMRKREIDDFRKMTYEVADSRTKRTLNSAWGEWAAVKSEISLLAEHREKSLGALSRLPLFCKPMDHSKEFFPIGTDDLIDLTEGWGSEKSYPVKFEKLSSEQLGQVAFLFGGVGDARHVMSTLCGLASVFEKFPEARRAVFHTHLTLLDIHAATIARDLTMFLLLDQLNHTKNATARLEIKATLMYIFCGVAMPSYCYRRLQTLFKDLKEQLTSPTPTLPPYLHVVSDTIPAILDVLDLWMTSSKSTRKMLESHRNLRWGRTTSTHELDWYDSMKVYLPPRELRRRHPGFSAAWTQTEETGQIHPSARRKAFAHVENDWKPNITIFDRSYEDPEYFAGGDGYPDMMINIYDVVDQLHRWNVRDRPRTQMALDMIVWDVCNTFFEEVAGALDTLGTHVTLEFVCGGLFEELAKMRCQGDDARPPQFPRKYLRMWLSNVPDYTHGPLGTILHIVPNLQDDDQAAAAANSLLNTPVWKDDQEFIHTYTLLRMKELPRYLGCKIVDSSNISSRLVFGSSSLPRPLSELATRDELTTWLTRVLFNTFFSGRTKPPPCNVRLPHNLVAFFGLLMHLHRIGYPGHWLSDFLGRVLSGRMTSDIVPFNDEYPIPVSHIAERVPSRSVRTDPWLVELETIIATAYYAVPFPITAALPKDFSRDADDIATWQAEVRPATRFMPTPFMYCSPFEPVTHLIFYRPGKMDPEDVIDNMRDIFEGDPSPAPGTFFILTAQEYVQYQSCVRFRLSRKRVERMRRKGWSMVAYRNDSGAQATLPVPIKNWRMLLSDEEEVPTYRHAAEGGSELDQLFDCCIC
ncbi:hypothetical protein L226DRAFT_506692 [Lentinus tigrinus ALCF2SS1-7]|uniref:DUF4470 domain-containing protein n=1 Tax=Lentinus tigrinus ALCF2SS1-6 TaxID=1328759 RepID=A0A5C2SDH4_9APHY|nr:hypothetical protein L227DRAFT_546043 [Lentinus tigrinus ALCF2SS1-6]RPD75970.1 hypothetical protein L226DRAFT_506692 [Lentinus tigrinus ALCF2SS1-7]